MVKWELFRNKLFQQISNFPIGIPPFRKPFIKEQKINIKKKRKKKKEKENEGSN